MFVWTEENKDRYVASNMFILADWFDYKDWLCQSGYNGRCSPNLNELNLQLQIFDEHVFKVHGKIYKVYLKNITLTRVDVLRETIFRFSQHFDCIIVNRVPPGCRPTATINSHPVGHGNAFLVFFPEIRNINMSGSVKDLGFYPT